MHVLAAAPVDAGVKPGVRLVLGAHRDRDLMGGVHVRGGRGARAPTPVAATRKAARGKHRRHAAAHEGTPRHIRTAHLKLLPRARHDGAQA